MNTKKIALVGCSDPRPAQRLNEINQLTDILNAKGIEVVVSPLIYDPDAAFDTKRKAAELMRHFADPDVAYIFDVSGGNLANTVLPELDFEVIRNSKAVMVGYSDLTPVLNAITAVTGRETMNYQIRHLLHEHKKAQKKYFFDTLLEGNTSEADLDVNFLRGNKMQGKVYGGNIRCFLKLAGTLYWPGDRLQGAILLLEAYSGGVYQIMTYLHQYKQLGVFDQISGVLLGTFSEMEDKMLLPMAEELVLSIVPEHIPVAKTMWIGHRHSARAILLGREACFI